MGVSNEVLATTGSIEVPAFLEEHHLGEFADMEVEAHGRRFTVAQAITECAPFKEMITAMATGLEIIPDVEIRKSVMAESIRNMGIKSASVELDEADKKKLKK